MIHSVPVSTNLKNLFSSNRIHVQLDGKYDLWSGGVSFDDSLHIEQNSALVGTNGGLLNIGMYSYVQSPIPYDAEIGRFSSLGHNVFVKELDYPPLKRFSSSPITYNEGDEPAIFLDSWGEFMREPYSPVHRALKIGNDVWVGDDVLLNEGVTIADGAVILDRTIVLNDIPAYAIVAGAPARIIGRRFSKETAEKLQSTHWWDYRYQSFSRTKGNDSVDKFINDFFLLKESGKLEKIETNGITAQDILDSSLIPD
ncbi:CatB-related O-acetyltransferase [Lactovum odontotermitis]